MQCEREINEEGKFAFFFTRKHNNGGRGNLRHRPEKPTSRSTQQWRTEKTQRQTGPFSLLISFSFSLPLLLHHHNHNHHNNNNILLFVFFLFSEDEQTIPISVTLQFRFQFEQNAVVSTQTVSIRGPPPTLAASTRSLLVSFQGEAFSLPISKKKEPVSHRKPTPERRRSTPVRDQRENSKPVDQQLWPGASRSVAPNPLSRSLDCGNERGKLGSKVSINGRLSLDMEGRDDECLETGRRPNSGLTSDLTASDTDSVSSGSTNGNGEISKSKSLPRNVMASARFWQETNSRLRRLQDPGSPLSSSPGLKTNASSKFGGYSKRFSSSDAVPSSSPRGMASPVRGAAIRSASPSKLWATTTSSPARALSSPSRVRNEVSAQMNAYNRNNNTPSILSFSADVRRGKIGEDRVMDAHLLRLLYNRYLQWRFVNARTEYTLMVQRLNAEKNLWNAWVSISELRHSVTLKRIKLLLLRQKLKLASILRGQMGYLEEWSLLDRDHSSSLSGATEALKASTLRLPILGKTVVDIQDLKHAVSSAVDVMQAMSSSIFSLTLKVDEMNSVMVEAVNVTAKEKVLLERCQGFLSRVAAMQVTDCSMKTHIIQLRPITSSLTSQQQL